MKNEKKSKNGSSDGSTSGSEQFLFKNYLEDTTTILVMLAVEKADSFNGEINPLDSGACKFYNGEVHDLMNYYLLMALDGKSNTENVLSFKDKLRDFLIIYEPHVMLELFELFPDENFDNPEHYLIKHTTTQLDFLFKVYRMLASEREFKELFKSINEYNESLRNSDDANSEC